VYPAAFLIHFHYCCRYFSYVSYFNGPIFTTVQQSWAASVLYNFLLLLFRVFCGLNMLFIMPVIFKCLPSTIPKHVCPEAKVEILPLDLDCSELVTHSGEILTVGKSHKMKPDGLRINFFSKSFKN
jgi:hypothetical protein